MLPDTITPNAVDLSLLDAILTDELEYQQRIQKARNYHDGKQAVFLTDRLREFLGIDLEDDSRFNLNVCRTVVEAVVERLLIEQFDTPDDKLKAWAQALWKQNHMDAMVDDTHEMAVRDGEAFLILDWDEENGRPRMTPHPRYVSVSADGDGFGFQMYYPDNDVSQPPLYAVKRWTETLSTGISRARATYYFDDRIEKYAYASGWAKVSDLDDVDDDGGEVWPIPWVDGSGEPLGIPVVHFLNKSLRPEAWDAIPVQDGINKTFLDLLASADMTGFRIIAAFGFIPTTDGKEPASDGSNALAIAPGQFIGTTKKAGEADLKAIDGADPTPLVNMLQKLILFLAMVTNTPVGRFQITGMVSSEQSQKQAEEPLLAKVRKRQAVFGDAWEAVLDVARRLETANGQALNEDAELNVVWVNPQTRSGEEVHQELKLKKELGVPLEQLWSELGYDEKKIEEMKALADTRLFP